jgi:hypothetical protein
MIVAGLVRIVVRVPGLGELIRGAGIVHLLMRVGMRFGKLRCVQDRQLAAAQHGYGEQRCNHDLL